MNNLKEFLLTSLALIFQSQAKWAACLWTAFSILAYHFVYIEALNFVVLCLIVQLTLYNKIFWYRILEILVISLVGVAFAVALALLIHYNLKTAANPVEANLMAEAVNRLGSFFRILTYPVIPLTTAFYALMVSHNKFTFRIISRLITAAYVILDALFDKRESRLPFVFLIVLYAVIMGNSISLAVGTPFVIAWIYIYVLNMRFDFKTEAVGSNKLATNLL